MNLDQRLRRLQANNTSGASTLLELAVDILEAFAEQLAFQSHHDFHPALVALVRALITAQPSMAPMINLAQQALQACPENSSSAAVSQPLHRFLADVRQHIRQSTTALSEQALSNIPPQATILTYSNSGTVIAALQYAHDRDHVCRVILSESRPAFDGRPQAAVLLQHGTAIEYGIDMALFERLPDVQIILVGADAVFPHGVVNKLGTHALAQIARHQRIPIYSLCTTNKFLPADATSLLQIAEHPSDEVWPDAPTGLNIRNHYFDTTPLGLLNGIVCEYGIYEPAALRTHLQQQTLSPALQSLY